MAIRYCYYGDDFTGSTDVLEQLASHGVRAVLFLGMPAAEHLAKFADVEAIGVAGDSRSRSPEWMSARLPEIFLGLKEFGVPVVHYKVCSTFDSSPGCGSIGRAMEVGRDIFSPRFIPVVVGAPHLRRYVAFGNLFAADADGVVLRIDRHPMSRHPVTPMLEADLRVHLGAQTRMKIVLVDGVMLEAGRGIEMLETLAGDGCGAVLFDTVDGRDLTTVGELVWGAAQEGAIFAVGSSGLTSALIAAWGLESVARESVRSVKPFVVVSGSCSVATERQVRYALAHGYAGIAVEPAALLGAGRAAFVEAGVRSLQNGRDTVFYTALGTPEGVVQGEALGVALGGMLREVLARVRVERVLFCGGDTASHAMQQLGAYALTWVGSLQAGAPLCRVHADSEVDGLEVCLKGGQVGTEDFFDVVRG